MSEAERRQSTISLQEAVSDMVFQQSEEDINAELDRRQQEIKAGISSTNQDDLLKKKLITKHDQASKKSTEAGRRHSIMLMEQLRDDSEPPLMALPAKKNTTTHDARIGATDLEEQLQKKMMTKHDTSQRRKSTIGIGAAIASALPKMRRGSMQDTPSRPTSENIDDNRFSLQTAIAPSPPASGAPGRRVSMLSLQDFDGSSLQPPTPGQLNGPPGRRFSTISTTSIQDHDGVSGLPPHLAPKELADTNLDQHVKHKMVTKHDMSMRRKSVLLMELPADMREGGAAMGSFDSPLAEKMQAGKNMSFRRKSALLDELPSGLMGEIDIGAAPPAATTPAAETKKKSRRRSMF
mmetsp:Transcript_104958/g.157173  ORF Transcript_104958/g.157173 Transcript_104958/m.157173 type:complete len:350 (+) Transcript_104958:51-1100(+)